MSDFLRRQTLIKAYQLSSLRHLRKSCPTIYSNHTVLCRNSSVLAFHLKLRLLRVGCHVGSHSNTEQTALTPFFFGRGIVIYENIDTFFWCFETLISLQPDGIINPNHFRWVRKTHILLNPTGHISKTIFRSFFLISWIQSIRLNSAYPTNHPYLLPNPNYM